MIRVAAAFYNSGNMPGSAELDRLLARIAELQTMLRLTESDDVREMVGQTLGDLEARLAEVTADIDARTAAPGQLDPARATS